MLGFHEENQRLTGLSDKLSFAERSVAVRGVHVKSLDTRFADQFLASSHDRPRISRRLQADATMFIVQQTNVTVDHAVMSPFSLTTHEVPHCRQQEIAEKESAGLGCPATRDMYCQALTHEILNGCAADSQV